MNKKSEYYQYSDLSLVERRNIRENVVLSKSEAEEINRQLSK